MAKKDGKKVTGIVLLVAPTALIILAFLLYAVINWIAVGMSTHPTTFECTSTTQDFSSSNGISSGQDEDCANQLIGTTPLFVTISNVILYIMGVIGVLTWLPSLVIGIVLLATRRSRAKD